MNKWNAILKIIKSKQFYLITANEHLVCEESRSKGTDNLTIAKFLQLMWEPFYKNIYLENIEQHIQDKSTFKCIE